jgi:hypothetical protein
MAKWCIKYCCWCSDAEEITKNPDDAGDCDYNCEECEKSEEIWQTFSP